MIKKTIKKIGSFFTRAVLIILNIIKFIILLLPKIVLLAIRINYKRFFFLFKVIVGVLLEIAKEGKKISVQTENKYDDYFFSGLTNFLSDLQKLWPKENFLNLLNNINQNQKSLKGIETKFDTKDGFGLNVGGKKEFYFNPFTNSGGFKINL